MAIREHSDANYWDYFFKAVGRNSTLIRQQYLGQIFAKTVTHYNLIFKDEFKNKQYVQNILIHSFVTNNYLTDYFDFLLSFYNRNLLRSLPEDFTEDFEDLSYFIQSTLSDDDILQVKGSTHYPSSSYQLLRSTRYVIAYYLPSIKDMLCSHLKLLDNFYYDDFLPEGEDRFSIFFKSYAPSLSAKIEKKSGPRTRGDFLFNRSPYLIFNGKNVYLRIPKQKFRLKDVEHNIMANISINDISFSYILEAYETMGIVISEEQDIEIPSEMIFSKIHIEIIFGATKSFEIIERFYRLFGENLNEISTFQIGEVYLLNSKEQQFSGDEGKVVISSEIFENWNMHYLNVRKDTVCYVGQTPLSIDGEFVEKVIFEETNFIAFDESSNQITTARKHPTVFFRADKSTFDGAFLWCNDFKCSLKTSPAVTWFEFSATTTYYGVTVNLEELLPAEDGEYFVILDEPGKHNKSLCHYLLISNLFFVPLIDKSVLNEQILVKVCGDYSLKGINCTLISNDELISMSDLELNSLNQIHSSNDIYYNFNLVNNGNCINFKLELNQKLYFISIDVDIIKYRLSENSSWIFHKSEYIWYTELTNELHIHIPDSQNPYLILDGGKKSIGIPEKDYFKFALHEFNFEIKKRELFHYSINLYYFDIVENKGKRVSLMKVIPKLDITRFVFGKDDNGVYVDTTFSGEAELCLTVKKAETNEIIESGITLQNGINRLTLLNPDETYQLEKIMIEPDEFGFSDTSVFLGSESKKPIDYEKELQKVPSHKKMSKPKI